MTVKLNLTVSEETAKGIKRYAERKNTSVSKIVDEYLSALIENEEKQKSNKKSFVEKYGGMLKGELTDIDKARDEYLKEKYGL